MANSTVKRALITNFKLQKIGMDFMGYEFHLKGSSYHHLIIPRRLGGLVTYENGAILMQNTAHNYLHTIERYDKEMFDYINKCMVNQKEKEYIDIEDLEKIKSCLKQFEKEYLGKTTKKGKQLIKYEYLTKRKRW